MLKYLFSLFAVTSVATISSNFTNMTNYVDYTNYSPNSCVSVSVSSGTGCDWMCNYCANSLGTNNYYFTDQVCTYYPGGCQGNPQAGVQYTCCSA
jgi:hypothetical protein